MKRPECEIDAIRAMAELGCANSIIILSLIEHIDHLEAEVERLTKQNAETEARLTTFFDVIWPEILNLRGDISSRQMRVWVQDALEAALRAVEDE